MMDQPKPILAGVVGWPVAHSRSPKLHGFWLQRYGVNGVYTALPVRPEDFASSLRALAHAGYAGFNITIPHKEAALNMVDSLDDAAVKIGAVNTIIVEKDGSLTGKNTDAYGFLANLDEQVPNWASRPGYSVILGAGGAARSIGVALSMRGIKDIRIVNRTEKRAVALASLLGPHARAAPWQERNKVLGNAGLLVNASSLGMAGMPPLEIDLRLLPPQAVVCDIVYAPLSTPLLCAARSHGLATVDGLGMLIHQARPGFEAWFGVAPQATPELRAALAADLELSS